MKSVELEVLRQAVANTVTNQTHKMTIQVFKKCLHCVGEDPEDYFNTIFRSVSKYLPTGMP
jgi:hypothetical protein